LSSDLVVADGIAYAASDTSLSQVDLLTGSVIQTLTLPGFNSVTGLAREGTFLYTMDTGRVLRAIDISGPLMITRGSLSMPDGGSSLFVGNRIAYAAAPQKTGSTGAGGFATA